MKQNGELSKQMQRTIASFKKMRISIMSITAKMYKYRIFSGLYFPVFSPNTGKYRPGKFPYLDTFHAVKIRDHSLTSWLLILSYPEYFK